MPKKAARKGSKKSKAKKAPAGDADALVTSPDQGAANSEEEIVPEGHLVCALTDEHRTASASEETLQSFIEQLHREYTIALEDMARDVKIACVSEDPRTGRPRTRRRSVSLVVYEPGSQHEFENIIRLVLIAKPTVKPEEKSIGVLDEMLGSLSEDRSEVYGLWTNGSELAFRMRCYNARTGYPEYTDLTDFPAPTETLEDLETAERRPLRVVTGDSLLRTFRRCHDYLYGNQSMRGDRAFWQLLYLIFCKILDEQQSTRQFFVGATEGNSEEGRKHISARIAGLFEKAKKEIYRDVFDGTERIELNDRALAYVAGQISRYSLLSTDTDAKGLAYESITSMMLKKERGQFFTPRNIIRMMVEMVDPEPGKKVFDPACGRREQHLAPRAAARTSGPEGSRGGGRRDRLSERLMGSSASAFEPSRVHFYNVSSAHRHGTVAQRELAH